MLVMQVKPEEEILSRVWGRRVFIFECFGCREVHFPEEKIETLVEKFKEKVIGKLSCDYLCRREFVQDYINEYCQEIERAEIILIFSCGVGTQVVSSLLEDKIVYTACDTLYLNGFQGLTVQDFNCNQCGECYLNYTGGICPLTNCPKGLLNGPCGGAKNGKCEVNPEADCAWELIYNRLKKQGRLNLLKRVFPPRNYQKIITESLLRKGV
ncbi:methylenetetrahydrofolate reductase C-terminal domain-containing protein [Candidatus Aerophobetes bacterium]|nr:methylenetetrahydrofolate reductase C-terminal domain-containing protein [Candidatus Aerophobetes bacterium]